MEGKHKNEKGNEGGERQEMKRKSRKGQEGAEKSGKRRGSGEAGPFPVPWA